VARNNWLCHQNLICCARSTGRQLTQMQLDWELEALDTAARNLVRDASCLTACGMHLRIRKSKSHGRSFHQNATEVLLTLLPFPAFLTAHVIDVLVTGCRTDLTHQFVSTTMIIESFDLIQYSYAEGRNTTCYTPRCTCPHCTGRGTTPRKHTSPLTFQQPFY
jgi:hypothetical protein